MRPRLYDIYAELIKDEQIIRHFRKIDILYVNYFIVTVLFYRQNKMKDAKEMKNQAEHLYWCQLKKYICSLVKVSHGQGLLIIFLILPLGWTRDFFTAFQ